jgi:hypothetical protein
MLKIKGWVAQSKEGRRRAGIHHQAFRHPGMFKMPGIVYFSLVEEGKTLISPCLTIQWIRNVGKVRRRGGSLCRLTRAPYSIPNVNKSYIIIN